MHWTIMYFHLISDSFLGDKNTHDVKNTGCKYPAQFQSTLKPQWTGGIIFKMKITIFEILE